MKGTVKASEARTSNVQQGRDPAHSYVLADFPPGVLCGDDDYDFAFAGACAPGMWERGVAAVVPPRWYVATYISFTALCFFLDGGLRPGRKHECPVERMWGLARSNTEATLD